MDPSDLIGGSKDSTSYSYFARIYLDTKTSKDKKPLHIVLASAESICVQW